MSRKTAATVTVTLVNKPILGKNRFFSLTFMKYKFIIPTYVDRKKENKEAN